MARYSIVRSKVNKDWINFRDLKDWLKTIQADQRRLLFDEKNRRKKEMLKGRIKSSEKVGKDLHILEYAYMAKEKLAIPSSLKFYNRKAYRLVTKQTRENYKKIEKSKKIIGRTFEGYKSSLTYNIDEKGDVENTTSTGENLFVTKENFNKMFGLAIKNEEKHIDEAKKGKRKEIRDRRSLKQREADSGSPKLWTPLVDIYEKEQEEEGKRRYIKNELVELEMAKFCLDLNIPKEVKDRLNKKELREYKKIVSKKKKEIEKIKKKTLDLTDIRDKKIELRLAIEFVEQNPHLKNKEKILKLLRKEMNKELKKEQKITKKLKKKKEKINIENYGSDKCEAYSQLKTLQKEKENLVTATRCWEKIIKNEIAISKKKDEIDKTDKTSNPSQQKEDTGIKDYLKVHGNITPTLPTYQPKQKGTTEKLH